MADKRINNGPSEERGALPAWARHPRRYPVLTWRNHLLRWIVSTEKDTVTVTFDKRLWDAADLFRANSGFNRQEYFGPTVGLLILRFAEHVCRCRPHGHELCSECVCP